MFRLIPVMFAVGLLVNGVLTSSVGATSISAKDEAKEAILEGTLKSVDAENATLVVTAAEKDTTVKTNDATKCFLNGKECKLADLKAGARVKVTHAEGTARKIEATIVAE